MSAGRGEKSFRVLIYRQLWGCFFNRSLLATVNRDTWIARGFWRMPETVDPTMMKALSIAGISVTAVIAFCLISLLTQRVRSVYLHLERVLAHFAEQHLLATCALCLVDLELRLLAPPR